MRDTSTAWHQRSISQVVMAPMRLGMNDLWVMIFLNLPCMCFVFWFIVDGGAISSLVNLHVSRLFMARECFALNFYA